MNHDRVCDIAVVGAGPAGATAAYLLARDGFDVWVFDKQIFPRAKLCAGLLTWKTIHLLQDVFGCSLQDLKKSGLIVNECRDYRVYFHQMELARGRLDYPFHFTDRAVYDAHWLAQARAAGAHVETGTAVTGVQPGSGQLTLADGRKVQSRFIIGADGAWSLVGRAIMTGIHQQRRRRRGMAAAVEARCHSIPPAPGGEVAALHFGHLPWGYGWVFPGPGCRTVGVCGLRRNSGPTIRKAFQRLIESTAIPPEISASCRGHALPYGNYLKSPAAGRVMLVGDACGTADPLLGEGIYYAHRSAELAARAIAANILSIDQAAAAYIRSMRAHLIRELRWIHFYRNLLFAGGRRRRYRGLKMVFRLFPKRLEAAVQGQLSFRRLLA